MKSLILSSICAVVVLGSCSSVYRTQQTPDDIYYSPGRTPVSSNAAAGDDYVAGNSSRNDGRRYQDNQNYSGYDAYATQDDRWLMMRVRDPYRWSTFDDYGSFYSPYNSLSYGGYGGYGGYSPYGMGGIGYSPAFSFGLGSAFYSPFSYGIGLGFGYGSYYNNYYNWNTYYNPYYYSGAVLNPKTNPAGYTTIRRFNPGNYSNTRYNTSRPAARPYNGRLYGNVPPNTNRSVGGSVRRIFSGSNNNSYNNQSQQRPVREYSPSNNNNNSYSAPRTSGGSSNNGGGGGNGSRPGR